MKFTLLFHFFLILLLTSCQEETTEVTQLEDNEVLTVDSELTSLMFSTSIKDGSADNILDNASCIAIKLPVKVNVGIFQFIVDSEIDYKVVEGLFDQSEDDDDILNFIFPITIILSDYEESLIENQDELNKFIENCKGDNEEDEDIECIDFQYPISFSIFNTDFQVFDVVSIEDDKQLYRFLNQIKNQQVVASLDFPVTLIYINGTKVKIDNNKTLATTIKEARNTCDEDDDNDYGDDDFTKERLNDLLIQCPWDFYQFIKEGEDLSVDYKNHKMVFKADGAVNILNPQNTIQDIGYWSTKLTEDGVLLSTKFDNNVRFDFEWLVYELTPDKIKLFNSEIRRVILSKNCDNINDITKERVKFILKKCLWRVSNLDVNGEIKTINYIGTPLIFYDGDIVKLRVNGELIEGVYQIDEKDNNITLKINLNGRPELNLEWVIYILKEDLIQLENINNQMALSQYCPDLEDDLIEINTMLFENSWRIVWYEEGNLNKTVQFQDWAFAFNESGKAFAEADGQNVYGSWLSYRNNDFFLDLNYGSNNALNILNYSWKIVETSDTRIQLKDYNTNGDIIRILEFEKQ